MMKKYLFIKLRICVILLLISLIKSKRPKFRDDYRYEKAFDAFYKLHPEAVNWHQSRIRCEAEGTELIVPANLDEADSIPLLIAPILTKYEGVYVGIHDLYSERTFVTIDGCSLQDTILELLWELTQPLHSGGRCVAMRRNGKLFVHPCSLSLPFACKTKASKVVYYPDCDTFDSRWKLGPNSTCYMAHVEPQTWNEAYSTCYSAGGHLAILDTREEAEYIRELFKQVDQHRTPGDFSFLGFSDLFQRYHYRTVLGAKVIMACRNIDKAEAAKNDIEQICKDLPEKGDLVVEKCDLSSLKSVREFSKKILDTEPHVNILVNNAGVMMCPKGFTEDGFETQFGTNHLAHFLLTMLLLPRIRNSTPARIVTVSSAAHTKYDINFDDLNYERRQYNALEAYSQSKLANVLFSRELATKLKAHNIEGVNTYSLHPGVIRTELGRHMDEVFFKGARRIIGFLFYPFSKTPELGAQTTIYCAVDEKCANETGLYYSDCVVKNPDRKALNDEYAKKLWEKSVELVKLGDYDPFAAAQSGVASK